MNSQDLPKPGTKFRVKAGCDAAWKAGDKTACSIPFKIPDQGLAFSRVLGSDDPDGDLRRYAGQWLLEAREGAVVVYPKWLERVEDENVPDPRPSRGSGVHAPAPGGDGAKTKQSPIEILARRNMDTIKITQQTLINGSPADKLSKSDVLGIIRDQESEIKRLESLAHKPEFLEKELAERAAGLKALVELVNSREKTADANAPVTRAELAEILKK